MGAVQRGIRFVAAGLALAAVAVGLPWLLIRLAGWPFPTEVPNLDRIVTAVRQGEVPGEVVIKALSVVVWLAWAQVVWALAWELVVNVPRTARGERVRSAPLVAPPLSAGIGRLVSAVLASGLLTASAPAIVPSTFPLAPAASVASVATLGTAAGADHHPAAVSSLGAPDRPVHERVVPRWRTTSDDTLWAIAERALGDGSRVGEILELNPGLSPRSLTIGAVVRLPADAAVPSDRAPSPRRTGEIDATGVATHPPASSIVVELPGHLAAQTITIETGDDLWSLAEERLAELDVASDAATVRYLEAVVDANPDVVGDPDLIFPGERFRFPAVRVAPRPGVERPAPEPPTRPRAERHDDPPTERSARPVPPPTVAPPSVPDAADAPLPPPPAPPPPPSSSTTTSVPAPFAPPAPTDAEAPSPGPSPLGIGQAALLSTGVLALLAARRRARLRAARPRARVPQPAEEAVVTERLLRSLDANERLLRVDVAIRAAAHELVDGPAQIAAALAATDGAVELVLTGPAALRAPWSGDGDRWTLPASTPVELLAGAARSVGAPCIALVPIGVDADGRDVLVDLEALGVLAIDARPDVADAVVRGLASALASSLFAESANVIAVGVEPSALLGHPRTWFEPTVDAALELAVTLVGTTAHATHSTFTLRTRHTSGEAWEPAIVVVGAAAAADVGDAAAPVAARPGRGVALVAGGAVSGVEWVLRAGVDRWSLEPLGLAMTPVGLGADDLRALVAALDEADRPLLDGDGGTDGDEDDGHDLDDLGDPVWAGGIDELDGVEPAAVRRDGREAFVEVAWALMVRVLGGVEVVDPDGAPATFERSKALELVAWLALHRERSTRTAARTALWELDVRDATFANVVSDARRALARLVEPVAGEEWLGRTLTEFLPLHVRVVTDADVVRARLDHARLQPPDLAIDTLRPAVESIRGLPFAGTGYLWPDAEGTTSDLVLLATSAATELAGHHLSMGDVEGVFWATGQGLRVLPGHEELIALRMRAHAQAGDLAGVRHEWESYERVLSADPWSDGQPAEKLAVLRRQLLA